MSEEFNRAEAEEAVRRAFYNSPGLDDGVDEETIEASLEYLVGQGLIVDAGEGRYVLTDEGKAQANDVMKDLLETPPPRAEADAHLYAILQSTSESEAHLKAAFELGQYVLQIEHERLAARLERFSDEWAAPLADAIRREQL